MPTPRLQKALAAGLTLAACLAYGNLRAEADGPDHWVVTGVADDDLLNIRAKPNPHAPKVGEIPPDGNCIRNLGCRGGLTFQEFTELSEAQKKQRLAENPRWCQVEYQGTTGWVAGRFLREGACGADR